MKTTLNLTAEQQRRLDDLRGHFAGEPRKVEVIDRAIRLLEVVAAYNADGSTSGLNSIGLTPSN